MAADFEDFARAASRRPTGRVASAPALTRATVLGGGSDARLIAALCAAEGMEATLFSAYGAELDTLRGSGIALRGAGPIGSYHVDREGGSIRTTAELDVAVKGAEAIFLTGPIHKQRTYAMVLADHLSDGQILVLAPARSLGAVETAWHLRMGGCRADVTIVEAQGLPYWHRTEGAALILSAAGPMPAATLPRDRAQVLETLAPVLPNLMPVDSVVASGFHDLSAAVDIPALILGGVGVQPGGPEVPEGAVPLPENATIANLIGPDQRGLIEALAAERRACAAAYGVRDLPGTEDWIAMFAGTPRGEGSRPVPTRDAARAIMRDGVIGSLVPLLSAAGLSGTPVPRTEALVRVTEGLLGVDIAAAGRRLDAIGIAAADVADARRVLDALATGGR